MRYIQQKSLSKCLNRRRGNPPLTTIAAKKAWRRTNKEDIRKACYKQQRGICAYTELSLDNEVLGYHLEHIAPRSSHPTLTFDANNIVLSIMGDVQSGNLPEHQRFGGHHKSETYSEDWFVSPFDRHCSDYFSYELDGLVTASTKLEEQQQACAKKTIEVLNLNAEYLIERRRQSLNSLNDKIQACANASSNLGNLSSIDDWSPELSALYAETFESSGKVLTEFVSAKIQLFERFGLNLNGLL